MSRFFKKKKKTTLNAGKMEQALLKGEKEEGYVVTADGRRIKLLDNPLPVPKKHVKKELDFDYEFDFDFDFHDRDDFDL